MPKGFYLFIYFFEKNDNFGQFFFKNDNFRQFKKKSQVFGNFLTFKWEFSVGSDSGSVLSGRVHLCFV